MKNILVHSHYLTPLMFGLQDCETGIKDFFNAKLYIIGYVGIGIAGVMVSQCVNCHFLTTSF